jgi:methionyl-tRNA formyltransferase
LSNDYYLWFNFFMEPQTEKTKDVKTALRVVFMGMLGQLSSLPLAMLIEKGIHVVAVIVPSDVLPVYRRGDKGITAVSPPSPTIFTSSKQTIVDHAFQHNIPLFTVDKLTHPKTISTIKAAQPDVICVSCFSKRIPIEILNLPTHGILNVHPSYLPQFRGPYPLFWTFREGVTESAVTIHFMDERLDTGDIVRRQQFRFKEGMSGSEANELCGQAGGRALLEAVNELQIGRKLHRYAQDDESASYAPQPKANDFRIETHWEARRAFNFIRGTAHWGYSFPIEVAGKDVMLATAVSYHPHQTLPTPIVWQGQRVLLQMNPGVLKARLRL